MQEAKLGEAFSAFLTDLKAKTRLQLQRSARQYDPRPSHFRDQEVPMKLLKLEDPTLETSAKVPHA